ncbi:glutathione-disulfide reductase [Paracoccaceae bacterium]|nr:glutathione-disulfide reductase [Paracoccaceae bacterium]
MYDLFVIGAGSGGVRAARLAATQGFSVGIAESSRVGGTCVVRGCVPKKLMVYAAEFSQYFRDSKGYGWAIKDVHFDWQQMVVARNNEVDRLEAAYKKNLKNSGVEIYESFAKLKGLNEVELDNNKVIKAKHILIATGGKPKKPEFQGVQLTKSSDDIFMMKNLPKKIVIYGAGYIACEFASIFKGLGSDVTLIYRGENLLRGFDNDISSLVRLGLEEKGINVLLNSMIESVTKCSEGLSVALSDKRQLVANEVVCATGRKPNIENLGLEKLGVNFEQDAVLVDEYQRTNISNVYAIGDVTDRLNLTPVAIRDGIAFVDTVFNNKPTVPDHHLVPKAVFTKPEVGTVGLSEIEAEKKGAIFAVYKTEFKPMKNQLSGDPQKTLMKMIVEKESDKILGVHIVGDGAAEMIQIVAVAVKMGATKSNFDATCAVHPTAAEELVTLN